MDLLDQNDKRVDHIANVLGLAFFIMESRTDSNTLRSAAWVDLLNHFHHLYLIKMCFALVERFSDRETDYHPCIKEAVKERPIASRFRL